MDSATQKRMILAQSEATGIRKKLVENNDGKNNDDVIEMGTAFEQIVQTKGWAYLEAYIINKANPYVLLFEPENQLKKGAAQGLTLLMQHVDQTIKAKNELLRKANEREEVDTNE